MIEFNADSLLYVGIAGSVVALDRNTGIEVWRTDLKPRVFVNLALDGDSLFVAARGEIFCLDAVTGQIRWNNPPKGLGWGLVTLAGTNIAPIAQQRANDEQSNAVAANSVAIGH
jgi:outer membrane protein assembly factor BamB